ncbi:MAG: DUF4147 domain-containing protein [Devosia marina]|uniref:DUF4147 domain-containing protein n=1 Tax=Devosia marina TaxID=2683198 RepID=UPI0032EE9A7B
MRRLQCLRRKPAIFSEHKDERIVPIVACRTPGCSRLISKSFFLRDPFRALRDPKGFLTSLFRIAVSTADPVRVVASYLPDRPQGRVVVVGAGKASARMAEAVEAACPSSPPSWSRPITMP